MQRIIGRKTGIKEDNLENYQEFNPSQLYIVIKVEKNPCYPIHREKKIEGENKIYGSML